MNINFVNFGFKNKDWYNMIPNELKEGYIISYDDTMDGNLLNIILVKSQTNIESLDKCNIYLVDDDNIRDNLEIIIVKGIAESSREPR